jgi:hypothetical protein
MLLDTAHLKDTTIAGAGASMVVSVKTTAASR